MVKTSPRIYVASLSDYNNGILHGAWIDAAQDVDTIREEIAAMLRESKHPNVTVDCPHCDGSGALTPDEECPECDGSGKVPSAEEYAIHDYEGFGNWKTGEHPNLEQVAAYAAVVDRLDEDDAEAFSAWFGNETRDYTDADDMENDFLEVYRGRWDSLADYAQNLAEDCGMIPKDLSPWIAGNIDWEGCGRDLELGGDVWTHEAGGDVFVFDNH